MKPNTVPAAGEAMPKDNSLLATITAYRIALADYRDNAPDDDHGANAYAEAGYIPLEKMLADWSAPIEDAATAIEAIRLASADGDGCRGCPAEARMMNLAMAYFDGIAKADPWEKSRRLMAELSEVLSECGDGICGAHILPMDGERFRGFVRRLPHSDDTETAVDRVERLSVELSDALSGYAGGSYQAMVQPSSIAGHSVAFVKVSAWSRRTER